jgi:hypothetical protein
MYVLAFLVHPPEKQQNMSAHAAAPEGGRMGDWKTGTVPVEGLIARNMPAFDTSENQ